MIDMCLCIKLGSKDSVSSRFQKCKFQQSYNPVTERFFTSVPIKHRWRSSSMDFPFFSEVWRLFRKIVLLLDFSFAETCISGILSSQKSLLPSFMHKHVDHGPRLSVFLRASQPVKFHDTSSYQDTLAILLVTLCLLL